VSPDQQKGCPLKALLVVDVQNDFCPGGALGIKQADKIIPAINRYVKIFSARKIPVLATRDWHPKKTVHFKKYGGVWPEHCVKNTKGARFHPKLRLPKNAILLYKGIDPEKDSYSAFQAQDKKGVILPALIKKMRIGELYIAGLATDYCVRFTAKDAIRKRLKVNILIDAVKGVDLKAGDSVKAVREIKGLGAKSLTLTKLNRQLESFRDSG